MISREKKIIVTLSVVLLALLGANFGLFWMTKQKVNDTSAALLELKKTSDLETKARALGDLVKQTASERQALDAYFVQKENSVKFIEQIEGLGKQAGLSLTVASVTVANNGKELRMNLGSNGSFDDTFYFVTLLETMPYKTRLEQVHLQKKDDVSIPGVVTTAWSGDFVLVLESFVGSATKQ